MITPFITPRGLTQFAMELFIVAGCGLALGFLGPFGTYAMPIGLRLAYWVVFGMVGYAIFRPLILAAEALAAITALSRTVALAIAMCVSGLPMAWLIGFAMNGLAYDAAFMRDGFAVLYVQTTAIGLAIHLMVTMMFAGRKVPPASPPPAPPPSDTTRPDPPPAPPPAPRSPTADTPLHAHLRRVSARSMR